MLLTQRQVGDREHFAGERYEDGYQRDGQAVQEHLVYFVGGHGEVGGGW